MHEPSHFTSQVLPSSQVTLLLAEAVTVHFEPLHSTLELLLVVTVHSESAKQR